MGAGAAVKAALRWGATGVSVATSLVLVGTRLAWRCGDILRSDVLVVYHEGGFGHTIHGPDLARRLFRDRRVIVFFFFQRSRHNPLVASIWSDVQLIFLPVEFAYRVAGRWRVVPCLPWIKGPWFVKALKWLFPQKRVLSQIELMAMAEGHVIPAKHGVRAHEWLHGYLHLLRSVPKAPPRLALGLRSEVERALDKHGRRHRRLCCLYLRAKGENQDAGSDSWRRNGSPLVSYWGAIRALAARGYLLLLVGDRMLDQRTRVEFGDAIVDARNLGISHDLLYLYAALESEIAVLECGGGSWLPIYRDMPHIVVNVLPFMFASPGGTLYYKSVLRRDGTPLPLSVLLGEFACEYDFAEFTVSDNDESELEEAVIDFVDNLERPRPWGLVPARNADLSPSSWHWGVESAISPVWMRRYGGLALEPARATAQS